MTGFGAFLQWLGWKAGALLLVVAVLVLLLFLSRAETGVARAQTTVARAALDINAAEFAKHKAADIAAQLSATEEARRIERAHSEALAEIGFKYERDRMENDDAWKEKLAAVRTGVVRVRDDRVCPAGVPEGAAGTGVGPDPRAVYLPAEAVERVLHLGAEADDVANRLRACQAVVRQDRKP